MVILKNMLEKMVRKAPNMRQNVLRLLQGWTPQRGDRAERERGLRAWLVLHPMEEGEGGLWQHQRAITTPVSRLGQHGPNAGECVCV